MFLNLIINHKTELFS